MLPNFKLAQSSVELIRYSITLSHVTFKLARLALNKVKPCIMKKCFLTHLLKLSSKHNIQKLESYSDMMKLKHILKIQSCRLRIKVLTRKM